MSASDSHDEPLVYIVDDEPGVRRAIARLVRADGWRTAEFGSPEEFIDEHDPSHPGCAILDLAMPSMSGLAIQEALVSDATTPPRRVVFLTGRAEVCDGVLAMKRGAVDFLTKPVEDSVLLDAVRRAIELDRQARESEHDLSDLRRRHESLTPREREVMAEVVRGRLNKQIAADLGTVEKTIKVHRARVMEKMGAASLADLVRIAERLATG